jgi:hypothetical protein
MNYTSTGEHESVAERNNRTIQECIRAVFHSLPFKAIPKVMLMHLAMDVTKKLNFFPTKGGVSDYYSPYVIMSGRKLDYNKHLKYQFGSYVQANQDNDPTNTNAPRTINAIYLHPMDNLQGRHELVDLRTGHVITRRKVTEIPITEHVIRIVEEMAEKQAIKSLKITGWNKQPIHPADWIAGVDYTAENNNEPGDNDNDDAEFPKDEHCWSNTTQRHCVALARVSLLENY